MGGAWRQLDLVASLALGSFAGPDVPKLVGELPSRPLIDIRAGEERLQGRDIELLVVGRHEQPPTSTAVQVAALFRPGYLVEIDPIAVMQDTTNDPI